MRGLAATVIIIYCTQLRGARAGHLSSSLLGSFGVDSGESCEGPPGSSLEGQTPKLEAAGRVSPRHLPRAPQQVCLLVAGPLKLKLLRSRLSRPSPVCVALVTASAQEEIPVKHPTESD